MMFLGLPIGFPRISPTDKGIRDPGTSDQDQGPRKPVQAKLGHAKPCRVGAVTTSGLHASEASPSKASPGKPEASQDNAMQVEPESLGTSPWSLGLWGWSHLGVWLAR